MSGPKDKDVFMDTFEPFATNDNRRTTKRRSSILKTDINNGNEERRASRRISWAKTLEYKELLADGTAVIMCQEFNQKSHEELEESVTSDPLPQIEDNENIDQNATKTEDKINALDFITRLKFKTTIDNTISDNPNKRQNTEEVNGFEPKKQKKVKRNGGKGMTKYLSKHYKTDDQKDCETVFNTSFNKYGRELVPRTERPDFTQLFTEEMNLTKMIESMDSNEASLQMSISQSPPQEDDNKTLFFTESINTSERTENNISLRNESSLQIETLGPNSFEESVAEINVSQENCDTDFNKTFINHLDDESIKCSPIPQTNSTDKPNATNIFTEDNNEMTLTTISEPSLENNLINETENEIMDEMVLTDVSSHQMMGKTITDCVEDMALTQCLDKTINKSNDSEAMKQMSSFINSEPTSENGEEVVENPLEEPNELTNDFSNPLFSSKVPKPSNSSRIPQPLIRKSILSSNHLPAINKFPKTMNCDQKKTTNKLDMGWLAQTTLPFDNNITNHNLTQNTQHFMEQSLRTEQTQTLRIGSRMSNSLFRRIDRTTAQNKTQTVVKTIQEVTQTNTQVITSTVSQISGKTTIESPNVKMNGQPISSVKTPNRKSLHLEMSKSVVKDMFGLGMTERLKQKRDEIEAMRRQSVVSNAFTPIGSNYETIDMLDVQANSGNPFKSHKNVSQLSADLFNSKTLIQNEDMEVEEESDSMEESKTINDSEVSSQTESESEISASETKSNSVTESEYNIEMDSKSSPQLSATESPNTVSDNDMTTNSDNSSTSNSSSSESSSLDFSSLSPLSTSIVHSSDNCFIRGSSPETIDPKLNFTLNLSDSSDSFDPFIHTNHSFYETSNPMQLSFMVREDTLFILADELERQMERIVIPVEEQDIVIAITDKSNDIFFYLRELNAKQKVFICEELSEERAVISYLWGTFALEILFGDVIEDPNIDFKVREIVTINMKSLISAKEPLHMQQKSLILKFNESHKPLLTMAHDLIVSSFEDEKKQIINKHKTTASLHQLVSDISAKVLTAKKLLTELRVISSSEICMFYPKVDDHYRLVIEILGVRKPIHLVLPINPKSYTDEVIRPEIKTTKGDKSLYCVSCLDSCLDACLRTKSRKYSYILELIRATKAFVLATKRFIYEKQSQNEERKTSRFSH